MPVTNTTEHFTHTTEQLEALREQLSAVLATATPALDAGDAQTHDDDDFLIFTTMRYDPSLAITTVPTTPNSPLLHESVVFLLDQHVRRLQRAAQFFGFAVGKRFSSQSILDHLSEALPPPLRDTPHRVKVLISRHGECTFELTPLPKEHTIGLTVPGYRDIQNDQLGDVPQYLRPWTGWTIYRDTQPSTPSPFTSFKTTHRSVFNAARQRFVIIPGDKREVLLIDGDNHALEGTITSVAFWRKVVDPGKEGENGGDGYAWVTPHLGLGNMDGVTRTWLLENGLIQQGVVKTSELKDGEYVLLMNGLMGIQPAKLVLT